MYERVSPVDGKTYAIGFEMRLPQGLERPLLPPGQRRHRRQRGHRHRQLRRRAADQRAAAGLRGAQLRRRPRRRRSARPSASTRRRGWTTATRRWPSSRRWPSRLIAAAYGKGPDRSYFGGCSNGGRHTLVAAARYADDYDGFLAGAPGYNLPLAALANIFGAQRYATRGHRRPGHAGRAGNRLHHGRAQRRWRAAVLARCDALDGASRRPGAGHAAPASARSTSMRDVPTCAGARDGSCLSQAQKIAIAPIFSGATTSNGERFYASFPFDRGIGGGGIPFWEFTAPLVLDSGAVGVIFKVPPSHAALTNGPGVRAGAEHRPDAGRAVRHQRHLHRIGDELHDAARMPQDMNDAAPPRRQDARLPRRQRPDLLGGRHRSPGTAASTATAAAAPTTSRACIRVPGMGHCSGGPATDQADFLTPLVAWVEHGDAPERDRRHGARRRQPRRRQRRGAGRLVAPRRTRPLCPYPSVAHYNGRGDVEQARSWSCHAGVHHHGHRHGHDDD